MSSKEIAADRAHNRLQSKLAKLAPKTFPIGAKVKVVPGKSRTPQYVHLRGTVAGYNGSSVQIDTRYGGMEFFYDELAVL